MEGYKKGRDIRRPRLEGSTKNKLTKRQRRSPEKKMALWGGWEEKGKKRWKEGWGWARVGR